MFRGVLILQALPPQCFAGHTVNAEGFSFASSVDLIFLEKELFPVLVSGVLGAMAFTQISLTECACVYNGVVSVCQF